MVRNSKSEKQETGLLLKPTLIGETFRGMEMSGEKKDGGRVREGKVQTWVCVRLAARHDGAEIDEWTLNAQEREQGGCNYWLKRVNRVRGETFCFC